MRLWLTFFYALLPGQCIVCQNKSGRHLDLCIGCQRDLKMSKRRCWQCGLELARLDDIDSCAHCIKHPPAFSHCFALYHYEKPVSTLIQQFKGQNKLAIGRVLGLLLGHQYTRRHSFPPDYWLPVPLHPSALRARGFNQAHELAIHVANQTNKPVLRSGVKRIRKTLAQKHLTSVQRVSNMKDAFQCNLDLRGVRIGIIDDVVTTGSTVSSLAETLIKAGAIDIQVACLARTRIR